MVTNISYLDMWKTGIIVKDKLILYNLILKISECLWDREGFNMLGRIKNAFAHHLTSSDDIFCWSQVARNKSCFGFSFARTLPSIVACWEQFLRETAFLLTCAHPGRGAGGQGVTNCWIDALGLLPRNILNCRKTTIFTPRHLQCHCFDQFLFVITTVTQSKTSSIVNAGQISNCTTLGRFDRQQCKEVALAVSTGKIIAHVGDDDGGGEGDDHQDQTSRTPEICWVCQDTLEIHQTLSPDQCDCHWLHSGNNNIMVLAYYLPAAHIE